MDSISLSDLVCPKDVTIKDRGSCVTFTNAKGNKAHLSRCDLLTNTAIPGLELRTDIVEIFGGGHIRVIHIDDTKDLQEILKLFAKVECINEVEVSHPLEAHIGAAMFLMADKGHWNDSTGHFDYY